MTRSPEALTGGAQLPVDQQSQDSQSQDDVG